MQFPETGVSGNGVVTYSDYDPHGNAGRKVAGDVELLTRYDGAGRILAVDAVATCGFEAPMIQYTYGTQPGSRALGKLQSVSAYNYYDGVESFCSKRLTGEIFSDGFEDGTTNAWSTTFSDDDSLLVKQTFVYDGFGNLTSITDSGGSRTISVDPTTNRLSAASYDSVGNMTSWGSFAYQWRPTGEMRTRTGGGVNTWFAYDAGGQRIAVEDRDDGTLTLTIRDLAGNVLRVFERDGEDWSWKKDYVYRNGLLLAAKDPTGTVHFTLDHLGTPRCLTDDSGSLVAEHEYFGFGEEATSLWRDEAMKLTGHERDLEGTTDRLDDLDYMRARYYNQHLGRFLSVDPIGGSLGSTQSFNRYAYVGNSPMNFVDPFGLARRVADQDGKVTFEEEIVVTATALPPWPDIRMAQWTVENYYLRLGRQKFGDIQWSDGQLPRSQMASIYQQMLVDEALGGDELLAAELFGDDFATELYALESRGSPLDFLIFAGAGGFLKGTASSTTRVTFSGYTRHGLHQAIGRDGGRGIAPRAILDTLRSPVKVIAQSNGRTKVVGQSATVILRNSDGRLITAWARNSTGLRNP